MAQAAKPLATVSMPPREQLRQLIRERSFSQGDFELASGEKSQFYFDMKWTMLDNEGSNLLAELVLEEAKGLDAHYIGGLEMGAVPLVVATVTKSRGTARPLQGFYIRKEAKSHGTKRRWDGYLVDGSKVILVEDVTTSGGSVLQAVDEVQKHACEIAAIITIVDREVGARQKLASRGLKLIPLFTASDFTR